MSKIPEPKCVTIFWATLIFLPLPHPNQVQSGIYCNWKNIQSPLPHFNTTSSYLLLISPCHHLIFPPLHLYLYIYWWLVTLVVAFGSKILGGWWAPTKDTFSFLWMQLEWCWVWEVVGTLKPYSLFKKNWTSCTHRWWGCKNFKHKCSHVLVQALALMLTPGGISTT